LIENIYDRWQTPGVTPHDRVGASQDRPQRLPFSGYPALYGRFKGTTRATPLLPPANTIALNPYARPQTAARAGDMPHGAQLLSTVRQSPTRGRDLYASPDGNIYLRKSDGWYRRQAHGKWGFYAPTQGQVERGQVAAARGGQSSAGYRITPTPDASAANRSGRGDRLPDSGTRMQDQQVSDLERQYYARTLAQYRVQNARSAGVSRPARTGGRR
jgi:hypothetical protein